MAARAAPKSSRAVETYLRNFEGEKARYQEILEITLCYGVQCLAQNFSLKGLSCNELRVITAYDAARNRDFYVRNASRKHVLASNEGATERTPAELRAKPPHSWRDGEVELADFPDPSKAASERPRATSEHTEKSTGMLYSLPPAFDEIDFHTKMLGKPLVDLAWKTFTGRAGSQVTTRSELEEQFCRIDQRKTSVTIPAVELPISSFAEFLDSYVTECVRQSQRTRPSVNGFSGEGGESINSVEGEEGGASIIDQESHSRRSRTTATVKCSAMGNTRRGSTTEVSTARKQRPVYTQQHRQSTPTPRSLAHVQSKIQPELDARRQKLLRVKKTQSQRMAESLARARLAEYEARRELQDVRDRRLGPKKMPLNEITKGAAALEIVDDFMKSPLMDTFGREEPGASPDPRRPTATPGRDHPTRKDPLREELYGTTALDDSFLGCKTASEPTGRRERRPERVKRNYNGWLGDFGPLHTKTVRPEWGEVDEDGDDNDQRPPRTQFEWNFEHLQKGQTEHVDRPKPHEVKLGKSLDKDKKTDHDAHGEYDSFADDLSDGLSMNSDPAFQWLKDTV